MKKKLEHKLIGPYSCESLCAIIWTHRNSTFELGMSDIILKEDLDLLIHVILFP